MGYEPWVFLLLHNAICVAHLRVDMSKLYTTKKFEMAVLEKWLICVVFRLCYPSLKQFGNSGVVVRKLKIPFCSVLIRLATRVAWEVKAPPPPNCLQ